MSLNINMSAVQCLLYVDKPLDYKPENTYTAWGWFYIRTRWRANCPLATTHVYRWLVLCHTNNKREHSRHQLCPVAMLNKNITSQINLREEHSWIITWSPITLRWKLTEEKRKKSGRRRPCVTNEKKQGTNFIQKTAFRVDSLDLPWSVSQ